MNHNITRRTFLKTSTAALAATAAAGVLSGCQNRGSGSIGVEVGDRVDNWNGLAVQLSGLFNMTVSPAQEGYEYVGVLVAVKNCTDDETYTIGAQNILEIDAAYPVPPVSNVDPYFRELVQSTTDFSMACDGAAIEGGAYLYVYDAKSNVLADAPTLPPGRTGYIELVCLAPTGWQELQVTYTPTFAHGQTITFTMQSSELITAEPQSDGNGMELDSRL